MGIETVCAAGFLEMGVAHWVMRRLKTAISEREISGFIVALPIWVHWIETVSKSVLTMRFVQRRR